MRNNYLNTLTHETILIVGEKATRELTHTQINVRIETIHSETVKTAI